MIFGSGDGRMRHIFENQVQVFQNGVRWLPRTTSYDLLVKGLSSRRGKLQRNHRESEQSAYNRSRDNMIAENCVSTTKRDSRKPSVDFGSLIGGLRPKRLWEEEVRCVRHL